MTRRPGAWVLVTGLIAGGCAYYNGLYNANHLAGQAARARREGRPSEARSLWEQAAVKAESVAVRFRGSRYREDALLLQGRALREAEQCGRALDPLSVVADSGRDRAKRTAARLLLGECQVTLGAARAAREVLAPLVRDRDPSVATAAKLWRARAAIALGEYGAALDDLADANDTAATFERAAALVGAGRPDDATQALNALAGTQIDEHRWLPALAALGGLAPDAAATLVDSLMRNERWSPGQRGRLLLADAERWERARKWDRAEARLVRVTEVAADSAEGRLARTHLLLAELRRTRSLDRAAEITAGLEAIISDGGPAAALADPVRRILVRIQARDGSQDAPDLRLFLLAESVRDSIGAGPLAAQLFRRVQADYPDSPIAPKALLAAAALEPASAESLLVALDRRYPDSPYRWAAHGREAPGFAVVEDSLRTLLEAVTADGLNRPRPAIERKRGPDDEEIRRPRRPPSDRRLPEP